MRPRRSRTRRRLTPVFVVHCAVTMDVWVKCVRGCWREADWSLEKQSWASVGAVEQQRPSAMKGMEGGISWGWFKMRPLTELQGQSVS